MYKIKESCAGCHQCELACPVQAVFYDGPKNAINADLCVECGLCETLCPTCSIYDDSDTAMPEVHGRIIRECDLVVCGGGSGLITAIKAGQAGKKVILLEKAKRAGGNMRLARDIYPAYSKFHAGHGLEDIREGEIGRLSARSGGDIENDLLRAAVYGCSEFIDWLLEFPGVQKLLSIESNSDKCLADQIFGVPAVGVTKRVENKLSKDPAIGPGLIGSLIRKTMLDAIPA